MRKIHVTLIAALLALAAVLGTIAATRTVSLGAASRNATYEARVKQLDAYAASLQRLLAQRAHRSQAPVQRVVYHRPPPVVVVRHNPHAEDEGGSDD